MADLLKCTWRKSVSVTRWLAEILAYTAVLLICVGVVVYVLNYFNKIFGDDLLIFIRNNLSNLNTLVNTCMGGIWYFTNLFIGLPWFVHLIWIAGFCIIGYSFLWCVHRDIKQELTPEDYVTKEVNNIVSDISSYIFLSIMGLPCLELCLMIIFDWKNASGAFGILFLTVVMMGILLTVWIGNVYDRPEDIGKITERSNSKWYIICRAPIAYYCKRRDGKLISKPLVIT